MISYVNVNGNVRMRFTAEYQIAGLDAPESIGQQLSKLPVHHGLHAASVNGLNQRMYHKQDMQLGPVLFLTSLRSERSVGKNVNVALMSGE